jgi:hypothetical protein
MIVEWFMDALQVVVVWIASLFPSGTAPDWLSSGPINDGLDSFLRMQAWIPVPLALVVTGTLFACWAIGFGIKLTRIIASFILLGGGSAG